MTFLGHKLPKKYVEIAISVIIGLNVAAVVSALVVTFIPTFGLN